MSGDKTEKISIMIGVLREKRGITQEELGNAIGEKRETITKWENGQRKIKAEDIVKLAKYFDVSTDYLLGMERAKKFFEEMHEYVKRHKEFFNMLLAAQDDEEESGINYDLIGLIEQYIVHKKTEGVFVLSDTGEVKYAKTEGEADRKCFMQYGFENHLDADEITKATFMKIIEDALNNLREYSLTF